MIIKSFGLSFYRKIGASMQRIRFSGRAGVPSDCNDDRLIYTTLLIGRNNSGKSTILSALEKFTGNKPFSVDDFNVEKLSENWEEFVKKYLDKQSDSNFDFVTPTIDAVFEIELSENDDTQNLHGILTGSSSGRFEIYCKLLCVEEILYKDAVINLITDLSISKATEPEDIKTFFKDYKSVLDSLLKKAFQLKFFRDKNFNEPIDDFKIRDLFSMRLVNFDQSFPQLTEKFGKLLAMSIDRNRELANKAACICSKANVQLKDSEFAKDAPAKVRSALGVAFGKNRVDFYLAPNLTKEQLLKGAFKFVFKEKNKPQPVPEDQFGAGYHSLIAIVSEIVEYFMDHSDEIAKSRVCLIGIEEPEVHMHPQMERTFIQKIDDMVRALLDEKEVTVPIQILISTHSSSVVKGKLDKDLSFDSINYLTTEKGVTEVIQFDDGVFGDSQDKYADTSKVDALPNDESPSTQGERKNQEKTFLLKYFKYHMTESFFADSIILVEGRAEEVLVPKFAEIYDDRSKKRNGSGISLNNLDLSILPIEGAYAFKYIPFFQKMRIPTAIITDADYYTPAKEEKGEREEKKVEESITNLDGLETTNQTIRNWNRSFLNIDEKLVTKLEPFKSWNVQAKIAVPLKKDRLMLCIEKQEDKYFPTSFEEAIILANRSNVSVKKALEEMRPRKCAEKNKDEDAKRTDHLEDNARYFQKLLSKCKGDFAIKLLANLEENASNFVIPSYIVDAFDFLVKEASNE